MDEFNYLSVLVSIILGLGITRLLTGLGQQIEFRGQIRSYWPATSWAVILLLIHVQTWWSMFGMRHHPGWTFLAFLVVLLQPIVLYLLAALALPSPAAGESPDSREHYYAQARWFFGLFCVLLAISVTKSLMLDGRLPEPTNLAFHVVFFVLSATAAITCREWFHRANTIGVVVLLTAYIAELFSQLR